MGAMKQQSLASQGVFEKYGRKSRRELFLDEIEPDESGIKVWRQRHPNCPRCFAPPHGPKQSWLTSSRVTPAPIEVARSCLQLNHHFVPPHEPKGPRRIVLGE